MSARAVGHAELSRQEPACNSALWFHGTLAANAALDSAASRAADLH